MSQIAYLILFLLLFFCLLITAAIITIKDIAQINEKRRKMEELFRELRKRPRL